MGFTSCSNDKVIFREAPNNATCESQTSKVDWLDALGTRGHLKTTVFSGTICSTSESKEQSEITQRYLPMTSCLIDGLPLNLKLTVHI